MATTAAQAEAEEELRLELEAVAAVYGDDVRVLRDLPPHLVVHVRPRTADDSSQQVRLVSPHPTPTCIHPSRSSDGTRGLSGPLLLCPVVLFGSSWWGGVAAFSELNPSCLEEREDVSFWFMFRPSDCRI